MSPSIAVSIAKYGILNTWNWSINWSSKVLITAQPIPPKRGGIHPTYGIFIGGGDLNDVYQLTGVRHYKYTSQRCSAKVINSTKQALLKAIDSKETGKFNRRLETTESSMDNELDKDSFVKQFKKKV